MYHDEIKIRKTAENKCYYRVTSILKSKQVSIKSKITLYKVVHLVGYQTSSLV